MRDAKLDDELDFFGTRATASPAASSSASQEPLASEKRAGEKQKAMREVVEKRQAAVMDPVLEEAEQQRLRKTLGIKVRGTGVPRLMKSFDELAESLPQETLVALREKAFFQDPTAIQQIAIPALLNERDIFGLAPTGSGKTAAFLLPVIGLLKGPKESTVRALVLAPTRELAVQIHEEALKLAPEGMKVRYISDGTTKIYTRPTGGRQPHVDLMVSTPMLVVHMLHAKCPVDLSQVEVLVFDEADRLFSLGFQQQIDEVIAACDLSRLRSISLFSATMASSLEDVARTVLRDPLHFQVGLQSSASATVAQRLVFCGEEEGKLVALTQMIVTGELAPPAILFVQSKERANELYKEMSYLKLKVDRISSDLPQSRRSNLLREFRARKIWYLVATDVMARGIDVIGVQTVVNFDLPLTAEQYIHRIGRTGRAGRSGAAITLYTKNDIPMLRTIGNLMQQSGSELPEWIKDLPKCSASKKKRLAHTTPVRDSLTSGSKNRKPKPQSTAGLRQKSLLLVKKKNPRREDVQRKKSVKKPRTE